MQLFYFLELHTEIIVTKHIGEYNKLCYIGEGKNAKILWIFLATLSVDARKTHILFDKIHCTWVSKSFQFVCFLCFFFHYKKNGSKYINNKE